MQADIDANEADSDAADTAMQADIDANEVDSEAADAAIQADVNQNEADSDAADADLTAALAANAAADAAENAAGDAADAALQTQIDDNAAASVAADGLLQSNIELEAAARANADDALQSQIDSNDGDISSLQSGLSNEITQRQFGDAANANAIGANTANLNTEIQNRIDGDQNLADYDAYLLDLISNTANTPLDVENILEGLDYFENDGNTVSLEAPYNALEAGSMMASTASFNAMDAQDIDVDNAEIQNVTVETNIYSPAGTIDQLNSNRSYRLR